MSMSVIGQIYVVYYSRVLPTDRSPNDQYVDEIEDMLDEMKYDLSMWGVMWEGRWKSFYNTNTDHTGPKFYGRLDKEKRLRVMNQYSGTIRPSIIVIEYKDGLKEGIPIMNEYEVRKLKERFRYRQGVAEFPRDQRMIDNLR